MVTFHIKSFVGVIAFNMFPIWDKVDIRLLPPEWKEQSFQFPIWDKVVRRMMVLSTSPLFPFQFPIWDKVEK